MVENPWLFQVDSTFIIIMTILGIIIIGSCALGVYSYHEMSQMDENAKMQTYITNLTGADLAKQKAEDEAELLRIEKERELALAEEEKRCIEYLSPPKMAGNDEKANRR